MLMATGGVSVTIGKSGGIYSENVAVVCPKLNFNTAGNTLTRIKARTLKSFGPKYAQVIG